MKDRTVEEVLMLGLKAIEKEHNENYQRLQDSHDDYVEMCGSFFDYLFETNGIEDFLAWARKSKKRESEIKHLSDYIRDLSEGRIGA